MAVKTVSQLNVTVTEEKPIIVCICNISYLKYLAYKILLMTDESILVDWLATPDLESNSSAESFSMQQELTPYYVESNDRMHFLVGYHLK